MDLRKTHLSLTEALKKAQQGEVIYLEDKTYFEKITITTPHLTLIGQEHTMIAFDASHGTTIPVEMGGDGTKVYGTTGSATVLVKPEADGFCAMNVTFQNTYVRGNKPNGQAVAFKSECSNILLKDCRFLGHQDTLYLDDGKNNLVQNCYIEGDIDFVFGSADCLFQNCILKALVNEKRIAYFLAPDTYIDNEKGFVFEDCKFLVEDELEVYLGRAWYPSGAKRRVYPRVTLKNCELDAQIIPKLIQMHSNDPEEYLLKIE